MIWVSFTISFLVTMVTGKYSLLLHGTGGNEDDLLTIAQMIDAKATILAPRGKVLENGMPRYFKRFAEGVFDLKTSSFAQMNWLISSWRLLRNTRLTWIR